MKFLIAVSAFVVFTTLSEAQEMHAPKTAETPDSNHAAIEWRGRLSTVHRDGDSSPRVRLSDVFDSIGFWAIGPLAGLRGEITVVDGRPFIARVVNDTISVAYDVDVEAPFLVYGAVEHWQETDTPDSVRSILQLESWLASIADTIGAHGTTSVFPFKITSSRSDVDFHIISNREPGYQISRPHSELMSFSALTAQPLTLVGVFSKEHAGIFTHHGEWTHIHVVSADGRFAGHVDSLSLGPDAVLCLPQRE